MAKTTKNGPALVIVESPTKAKTISRFLGDGYVVEASVGHIRDLPKNELGVDVDNDFQPKYVAIRGKGRVIQKLKQASKSADVVYLAPDPDREGEAIAWHIAHEVSKQNGNVYRITFNEITKKAIVAALDHRTEIDVPIMQLARNLLHILSNFFAYCLH